jgi:hypothetical protein
MTTTTKTNRNTKNAGYKEGVNYIAAVFSTVTDPKNLPTSLLIMVADLFERPMEKVLMDVSKALVR